MSYKDFRKEKPEINRPIKLSIGGNHYCFAEYIGNNEVVCDEALSKIKLNVYNDFDKNLMWKYI